MNRLSNYYRSLLLFLVIAFFGAGAQAQDCQITLLTPTEGCAPYNFKATAVPDPAKTVASYQWDYGDATGGNQKDANHFFSSRGTFCVSVKIKYTDGTECTASLANCVKVYGKPKAAIILPANGLSTQCFKRNGTINKFCFSHQSKRSADGFALTRYQWNFGDGDTSSEENPCHSYDSAGQYTISLEVWDEKGCSDRQVLQASIIVLPDIKTNFTLSGKPSCDSTTYTFLNKTDTFGILTKKWYWDYGDGSPLDSVNWNGKHTYTEDGTFTVTLRIINQLGCEASASQPAKNIIAKLEVFYKDTICWTEAAQGVNFYAKEIEGASYWEWSFDDPPSGPKNSAPFAWNASHEFKSGPKNYQVKFTMLHPICGKFDTCIVLHVMGPQAVIKQPDPIPMVLFATNDYVAAKPMPKSVFVAMNSANNCVYAPVKYSIFTKLATPKREVRYIYNDTLCNATVDTTFMNSVIYCDGDTQEYADSIKLVVVDSVVTITDSVETKLVWNKGNPIPTKPYYPSSGQYNFNNMHDSNLFTCVMPDLVRFTNHSIKYRLYKALDDNTTKYVHYTTPEPDYPPIIFENGWKDTCKNPGYPFASDSMAYFWDFQDGDSCTSSVANKNWDCQYSTLIAPYHNFSDSKPPKTRCQAVKLTVKDLVTGCQDSTVLQLKQGPPQAWFDRSSKGYCKMTWEMQTFGLTPKGDVNDTTGAKPLRGFILNWDRNCTGYGEFFRFNFTETLPSCEPAQDYWLVFDSAAARKEINCGGGIKMIDYGFLGASNAKGYKVGGPKKDWEGLPWQSRYWWMDGDEGCKTVGVVLKNGDCYDTAWYHDYICFNRLTAEFTIYKENTLIKRDGGGHPIDTSYYYTLMDSSQSLTSQASKVVYCHALGAPAAKPGFNIALTANDRDMPVVTNFYFQLTRQEFPAGDYYYNRKNGQSVMKGFWPDTANINPFNDKRRKTDLTPIDPNNQVILDSISAIYDTAYIPMDTTYYTYQYDENGNVIGKLLLANIPLRTNEVNSINNTGQAMLQIGDYRSRMFSTNCKDGTFVIRSDAKLVIKERRFLLRLRDNRPDDKTFAIDMATGKPMIDSIPLKDTVKFTLPYPGFYTIQSVSANLDGCAKGTLYHLIYGHFARFNIVGGDSIICVGDTIRIEHLVRYWTTTCPPPPGSPPPAGCIDGTIDNYTGVLNAWDVKDPVQLRQALNTKWKAPAAGLIGEEIEMFWGDGVKDGGPSVPNNLPLWHVYKKPGIYDLTLRTTDSNGCTINTVRRNFVKVVGLDAKYEINPLRDTVTYCRKDIIFKDKTELVGSELPDRGKFGYKEKIVRKNSVTGKYYYDSARYVVDSIIAWRWEPGNGTPSIVKTGSEDSLYFVYLRYGKYSPRLTAYTANVTPKQCADEQYRKDYLRLVGPVPDFSIGDTVGCMPFTVKISVHNDSAEQYEWIMGDGSVVPSSTGEKTVEYTYTKPGHYRIFVKQTETHFDPSIQQDRTCYDEWPLPDDTTQFWVTVHPYGPLRLTGDTVVCVGQTANFVANSDFGEYKIFDYDYNNGTAPTTGPDSTGSTIFQDTGYFYVTVKGTTEFNCTQYDTLRVRVEGVSAEIGVDSTFANLGRFTFMNNSKAGVRFVWNFGDKTNEVETSDKNPIVHEYTNLPDDVKEGDEGDESSYNVILKSYSKTGCERIDTVVVKIPRKWKRYNVLTPNGDEKNDVFNPKIEGETAYDIKIYNRWGEQVFESNSSDIDWNGKVNNTGGDCPEGTYFYVWKFTLVGGVEKTLNGTVTLIR